MYEHKNVVSIIYNVRTHAHYGFFVFFSV